MDTQGFLKKYGVTDPEVLDNTPRRVAKYWDEMLDGQGVDIARIPELNKVFYVPTDAMVMTRVDNIFSTCEHHLALMYDGVAVIGYVPIKAADGYRVIGLSKIPRIVKLCSHRLTLQERLTSDIAKVIEEITRSRLVYVTMRMKHACVCARGANANSITATTYMSETLQELDNVRAEFERKAEALLQY